MPLSDFPNDTSAPPVRTCHAGSSQGSAPAAGETTPKQGNPGEEQAMEVCEGIHGSC